MNCHWLADLPPDVGHVSFTGTQRGMTRHQKAMVYAVLKSLPGSITVHHGCCVGADEETNLICAELQLQTHGYPSDIPDKRGRCLVDALEKEKRPLERNQDIVNAGAFLLAAPRRADREELRSGTWATMRYARKQGKQVLVVTPEGDVLWAVTWREHYAEDRRRIEEANRALQGVLPDLGRVVLLTADLEQFVARDMCERPLHGVPSSYLPDTLDNLRRACNTYRSGDARRKILLTFLGNVQPLADIIGTYLRPYYGRRIRDSLIRRILLTAAMAPEELLDTPRVWMHAACAEALSQVPWIRRFRYTEII